MNTEIKKFLPKGFKKELECRNVKSLNATIKELQFYYKAAQPDDETEESALFYLMKYRESL